MHTPTPARAEPATAATCLLLPCYLPPSTGSIVCKRAEQLNAAAVVMAKHNKGAMAEFFIGSVSNYCTHHSKAPVLIMHAD